LQLSLELFQARVKIPHGRDDIGYILLCELCASSVPSVVLFIIKYRAFGIYKNIQIPKTKLRVPRQTSSVVL